MEIFVVVEVQEMAARGRCEVEENWYTLHHPGRVSV